MNYVDILFFASIVIGLLTGLLGKAPKKIASLVTVIVAIAVSYFTCGLVADMVKAMDSEVIAFAGGQAGVTIEQFVLNTIDNATASANIPVDALAGIVGGIIKMLVFWVETIVLLAVLGLIEKIISAIAFKNSKKNTAWYTLGVPGALNGFLVAFALLFPLFALSPVLGNLAEIDSTNETFALISEQVSTSKIVDLSKGVLGGDYQLECLKYESNGKSCYLYDDIKSIGSLSKMAGLLQTIDESNPIESIASMSDDDIRELFESIDSSETVKEVIGDVIEGLDLGIEIDVQNIDFSKEADTFIAVKGMVEVKEDGTFDVKQEFTEEEIGNIVDAIAQSDLIEAVANNAEGALSQVSPEVVENIDNQLQSKLEDGTISQEKYDTLMALFGNKD